MELLFGTNVCEHGYRIGRLAGVEVDPATRRVRGIVFSTDGDIGAHTEARPLVAVPADHFDGDINLRPFATSSGAPTPTALTLTAATRLTRAGRTIARLAGVEIAGDSGELSGVLGRAHWWSRRFHTGATGLDLSVPGEIRIGSAAPKAA
jgi:hypothetical protein